jgi:hypothetical protein
LAPSAAGRIVRHLTQPPGGRKVLRESRRFDLPIMVAIGNRAKERQFLLTRELRRGSPDSAAFCLPGSRAVFSSAGSPKVRSSGRSRSVTVSVPGGSPTRAYAISRKPTPAGWGSRRRPRSALARAGFLTGAARRCFGFQNVQRSRHKSMCCKLRPRCGPIPGSRRGGVPLRAIGQRPPRDHGAAWRRANNG